MRTTITAIIGALAALLLCAIVGLVYAQKTGLSARATAGSLETRIARSVRHFAVSRQVREQPNPVPASPDALADGMEHFADHCAVCHANDGSGDTEMGKGLFPRPPDMRLGETQALSDGELFNIIENGIRFTGMPGFGTGSAAAAQSSWRLVLFVRHLPQITPAEREKMQSLNPRSPEEVRQEIEEQQFLQNDDDATRPSSPHSHEGGHK
jgi:mono/diheme cytochrome c family protein